MAKQTRLKGVSLTVALTLPKPAKGVEAEHELKRYRVVGLYRKDHEPNKAPCSAYVLVSDSATGETDAIRFVETDIDEAMEAFQQGRIDLCLMPPKVTMRRIPKLTLSSKGRSISLGNKQASTCGSATGLNNMFGRGQQPEE